MEYIPLLHTKKSKIQVPPSSSHTANELLQHLNEDQRIYLYDHDGIEHNKPNLDLYKPLCTRYTAWIDNGPRCMEDLVDTVMTGAQHLTLRKQLWPTFSLFSIKELTDNNIYLFYHPSASTLDTHDTSLPYLGEGVVVFNESNILLEDYSIRDTIKKIIIKFPTYLYEPDPKNFTYWKNKGIQGLLIDLSIYTEHASYAP